MQRNEPNPAGVSDEQKLLYPVACVHEVIPVACETNDFTAVRFSVNVGFWPKVT